MELIFEKIRDLNYGENPHQSAGLYTVDCMADYELIFGDNLTYDNILNLNEITAILSEFYDVNSAAITKHGIYCGVALGRNIEDAYNKAFDCDPVSAFYGSIGFSQTLDYETAKLVSSMGVKVVIAPDYDSKAAIALSANDHIKLVKLNTPLKDLKNFVNNDLKVTPFGMLIQSKNYSELNKNLFKVVTKTKPTSEQIEDAIFAWKIVKYTRTDSAVVVKDFATKGIAQGCSNSTLAVENALNYACDGSKDAILATDGVIYSQDTIFAAAQGRIKLIIQTGGSDKDSDLIKLADKYEIAMIMTGVRNHRY